MKLITARLMNKLGQQGDYLDVMGQLSNPSVVAQNYYQVNQNLRLKAIITVHVDAETIERFDSVAFNGKKLRILAKSETGFGTQRLEVGN